MAGDDVDLVCASIALLAYVSWLVVFLGCAGDGMLCVYSHAAHRTTWRGEIDALVDLRDVILLNTASPWWALARVPVATLVGFLRGVAIWALCLPVDTALTLAGLEQWRCLPRLVY